VLGSRFAVTFDDRRKSFPAPGTLLVRGTACVRPDQPDVVVILSYAQRAAATEWTPEAEKSAQAFVDSLRFLPSNPKVIEQAGLIVRGDTPHDAVALLAPTAEEGDIEAAVFLGNLYLYGRKMDPDYEAARKWLEIAAKDGRPDAMYNLGAMYDKAVGMPRDVTTAIKWFTLAADQRDAQAQLNIALLYLNGDGVPKDIATAELWLKRAAGNGNKRAEGILAHGKYKETQ
jgi:TPR repeat protein